MIKEFKAFIMRGNVIDMAVGIIIGAAFGKIVTSLVNDILMPPLGLLIGRLDFSSLYINLSTHKYHSLAQAKALGAPTINYGVFINIVLDFLIVSFVIFLLIKQINRLKAQPVPVPPDTKECPFCFTRIPIKAVRCPNCTTSLTEQK